ncbi:hypothetical protein [Gluconobacter kondonii]|uniref:hypothetical protein n=1 Tax=Gluconobacter kondonii TaxID=941463 RepID=UPI001B8BCF5F|nr:hypothetical protein [Gluconobacter kondonii]MBS1079260.1 hypothetical protein [Gluconobacter kondonii]
MTHVTEGVLLGALKKVIFSGKDNSWDLFPNLEIDAAIDLREFINQYISYQIININNLKYFLSMSIDSLIDQRIEYKSKDLDEYEAYLIKRSADKSRLSIPHIADILFHHLVPTGK